MHNVKRVPVSVQSAEVLEQRRAEEARKLDTYKQIEDTYLEHRRNGDHSTEALESTTSILSCNPEYYSAWNYRRTILLYMFEQGDTNLKRRLLEGDLLMLQQSMKSHPKVYWLWNHRRWCLCLLPSSDVQDKGEKWRQELRLVNMMLEMDPRNFMGWNYRRWVIEELAKAQTNQENVPPFPSSLSSDLDDKTRAIHLELARHELKYTLTKIEQNFSNFSAWHNRSKLLPRIWDGEKLDAAARSQQRQAEFELLQQAMYTDPGDQSIWIYHRWLVSLDPNLETLKEQIQVIHELAEMEPESKRCMQSLAHYKQQLLSFHQNGITQSEAQKLENQVREHLTQLEEIDSLRRHRYRDLLNNPPSSPSRH